MSIPAINYVLRQQIGRSTEKFILLCMANYADENGVCYPSRARLEQDTDLDRKTIIAALSSLLNGGHISDTGNRTGATNQIIIYQINGIPEASKTHYTYKVTCQKTGEFYIGKRSFNGNPEHDVYRGSCEWVRKKQSSKDILIREVLAVYFSESEALAAEAELFRKYDHNPLCVNLGLPSKLRAASLKGTKNGTIPFFPSKSPVFPDKSPVFPVEESQKRDTEPSITINEPSSNRQTGELFENNVNQKPKGNGHAKRNGKSTLTELPIGFEPDAQAVKLCAELDVDITRAIAEFRDWCAAKRPKYHDWQATFRNSVRRFAKPRGGGAYRSGSFGREPAGIVAAGARVAARYSRQD